MFAATEIRAAAPSGQRGALDDGRGRERRGEVDFDLHGVVGVRLLDATPADADVVRRQLGAIEQPLTREPDVEIEFVDQVPVPSRLRLLDLDDVGYTDDEFFVFRRKRRGRTAATLPLADVGGRCRIVCESGAPAVPFLVPIVNLTALAKGVLPLHASAFVYEGVGILVGGWAKGGKTEILLAFMANGAEYVGDEWTYLDRERDRMFGLPEPIKLWDWHLDELPAYRRRVRRGDRARFSMIKLLAQLERVVPARLESSAIPRFLDRAVPLAKRQLYVRLSPAALFGSGACATVGRIDKVILTVSHAAADVVVERIDVGEVVRRMPFSLERERLEFRSCYLKFRFAFPDARNPLIEEAEELERNLLEAQLLGKDAYVVYHPFPAPIPGLFEAIRPLVHDA